MTYDKYNAPPKQRCKSCREFCTWYDYPRRNYPHWRYECRNYACRRPSKGKIEGKVVGVDVARAQSLWEASK